MQIFILKQRLDELKKTKEVEKLQFVEFKKFNMKCEIRA